MYDDLYDKNGDFQNESKVTRFNGFVEEYVINSIMYNNILTFQFERLGYFKFDHFEVNDLSNIPVFIRIIDLTDTYNK